MKAEERVYQLISSLLTPFGFAIVRRRTLDRLIQDNDLLKRNEAPVVDLMSAPSCTAELASTPHNPVVDVTPDATALLRHQIASKWSSIDQLTRLLAKPAKLLCCPLCGFKDQTDAFRGRESFCIFGGGVLLRHQCPECDLVFGPAKMLNMTAAELSLDYEWHYRVYQEGDSTAQELRSFHALEPKRDGVYLNYGAGSWSRSVQQLREEGWQVFAYEPHVSAAGVSNDNSLLDKPTLLRTRFDGIYSNNVLEHLRDPVGELRLLASLLTYDGRMAHTTPCFEYLYEFTRFHLFFFLDRSRQALIGQAGLTEIEYIKDGEFMCSVLERMRS